MLRTFLLVGSVGLILARWFGAPDMAAAADQDNVAGLWLDDEGRAAVDIAPCGAEMCGKIVWLKQPLDPDGKPWLDKLNPDDSKKTRAVCGLQIIGGLKPDGKGGWQGGWIYDPEAGQTFDLDLLARDANTLTVKGYLKVKLLSESYAWKRLPLNTPRCAN